ncbi:substrate-binding family protein [Mucilaginibacter yixingensis]|uniref:Substrate-binding family protein n=1 Tax=Mucilaginibacter yixingensis TaxID=1295612 RepID=A0A2T5JGS2_9SPHI|nr:helical backbone metal receptor [Mucilaginibacter yixingensis]PTR01601.1 substrate-binding family protein [Mucilaginibacter yixingensis]
MPLFADQLGRKLTMDAPPQRIISLVPSQTELLFDLDLGQQLVGLTKFCIHPQDKVATKTKVGGTKQLDIPLIRSLEPDLIIANKEENERGQIEQLMAEFPVYVTDVDDLEGALQMINGVGALTDRVQQAAMLTSQITRAFDRLKAESSSPLNVVYLIWRKPWMAAGKSTFIDDMLSRCGWQDALTVTRYPQLTEDMLRGVKPDVVLLSSEPYPFKEKHIQEIAEIIPQARVELVDGEMFSWYGSRLLQAPEYFIRLINRLK